MKKNPTGQVLRRVELTHPPGLTRRPRRGAPFSIWVRSPSSCGDTHSAMHARSVSACSLHALILTLTLGFLLSGCVSSMKYRLAKPGTPPAQPLNLTRHEPPLQVDLASVIVFKGPGSWKREARWDEYVVTLVNHGEEPILIESAQLIDVQGQPRAPGADPWKLEQLSRSNWDKYGSAGLAVVAGAGATAIYVEAVASTAVASLGGFGGTAAAGAGAGATAPFVLAVIPLAAVADVTAVAIMNHRNKISVQKQFQQRRLTLPFTIAPGESASGSLFFPMTPGPKQLVVGGQAGERTVQASLDLEPLAGLHLKASK